MLGEEIGQLRGQVTVQRVLPSEGQGPKMEVTLQDRGTILGLGAAQTATFISVVRPDGTLYAEGEAVVTTDEGEVATWKGSGVGRLGEGGAVNWRGAIYFQTASEKLAPLNSVAAIFEYEIDAEGNTDAKIWEWK